MMFHCIPLTKSHSSLIHWKLHMFDLVPASAIAEVSESFPVDFSGRSVFSFNSGNHTSPAGLCKTSSSVLPNLDLLS